jgi:ferredoxin
MHLLDVAHKNNIDLEGACEASLACSTCHVIIKDPALYNLLPEPTDEENDMLDLAFGLTETYAQWIVVLPICWAMGLRLAEPNGFSFVVKF